MSASDQRAHAVPYIPEEAPFSEAQRAWLNGFLAGMFSRTAGVRELAASPADPLLVLFGSQTGTAERFAKRLAREARERGFDVTLRGMEACPIGDLTAAKRVAVLVSTHGDGDPPDQAQRFIRELNAETAPRLDALAFAVLALGDSTYRHFAKCGRDLDERLGALGATRAIPRVDADVEIDPPFRIWRDALFSVWTAGATSVLPQPAAVAAAAAESAERQVAAPVLGHVRLNRPGSDKDTRHIALRLEHGLTYEVGDALGVVPRNPPLMVDEVLAAAGFDGEESVIDPAGRASSLRRALSESYEIGRLGARTLRAYAERAGDKRLREICADDERLRNYLQGRDLIDLLLEFPGHFEQPADLVALLPRLTPRLYSIASSPRAHEGEVHLCVGAVRYRAHARERFGICSTFLATRARIGEPLETFIRDNPRFRPPADGCAPMIMIGPGTGVAPFRAFLADRRAQGGTGPNWLFFGDRHRAYDFLYEEELRAYEADGFARLSLAFSRDLHHKVYVQHLLLEAAGEIWSWLENGAHLYVCGDATQMAKDVEAALRRIVMIAGGSSDEEAVAYLDALRAAGRYARDVY